MKGMIHKYTASTGTVTSSWRHIACPIMCVNITYLKRTNFSVNNFVPWEYFRNNNHLRNICIEAKENKGICWENNANILKKKLDRKCDCGNCGLLQSCERQLPHNVNQGGLYLNNIVWPCSLLFSILFLHSWESHQWGN